MNRENKYVEVSIRLMSEAGEELNKTSFKCDTILTSAVGVHDIESGTKISDTLKSEDPEEYKTATQVGIIGDHNAVKVLTLIQLLRSRIDKEYPHVDKINEQVNTIRELNREVDQFKSRVQELVSELEGNQKYSTYLEARNVVLTESLKRIKACSGEALAGDNNEC